MKLASVFRTSLLTGGSLLLAAVSGLLMALALPPFNQALLGWFALAPLLVAARGRRGLEAFGLGLLAGLVCGYVHRYLTVPFLLLAFVLAGAAAAANAARRHRTGAAWALSIACAGILLEWLTVLSPIPLNLAFCQYRTVPVLQIASLTGVWGVSFLLWWTNAVLADAAIERRWDPLSLRVTAALLVFTLGFGGYAMSRPPGGGSLRVAAIQDHVPGEAGELEDPASLAAEAPDREQLTRTAAAKGAQLIVWSEGCLGGAFSPESPSDPTTALAEELGTHLVPAYSELGQPKGYNCAALVSPGGEVLGVHRKIHLYLGERNSVSPGREARVFETSLGRIGLEICFDSCYPGVTRRLARAGAQLIAMPNYDPPSPGAVLHHLHAAVLPFRAVENGVPFVRADPNGFSQVIDAHGRIVAESPLWRADALVADVGLSGGGGTLYTRTGDLLPLAALAALVYLTLPAGFLSRLRRPWKRT